MFTLSVTNDFYLWPLFVFFGVTCPAYLLKKSLKCFLVGYTTRVGKTSTTKFASFTQIMNWTCIFYWKWEYRKELLHYSTEGSCKLKMICRERKRDTRHLKCSDWNWKVQFCVSSSICFWTFLCSSAQENVAVEQIDMITSVLVCLRFTCKM